MKEYKHIYVEEARRQLEARKDRSAWNRAVTEDAIDLLDTVNDRCEQVTRQFAETEEGGMAHTEDLFKSRKGLMEIMRNGAESWQARALRRAAGRAADALISASLKTYTVG